MNKNKRHSIISYVLVILLIFTMMPYMGSSVYAAEGIPSGGIINENGDYQLSDGYSGTITIGAIVTAVKIIGDTTNMGTQIIVDGGRTSALELTIENLNITAEEGHHGIDFGSAGNYEHKLYISGTCKITGDANQPNANEPNVWDETYGAGIHVPLGVKLTIDKMNGLTDDEAKLEANGGHRGAGIGGGYREAGGNITINGGIVTANGGNSAAGIGGGEGRAGGNITISGGTVTANGGNLAAGIGGGHYGPGGNITIIGGAVTANGGSNGAGIGGGMNASGGVIIIDNNPTVIATKGVYAPFDIGNGRAGSGTTTLQDASENDIHYIRTVIKDNRNQGIANAIVTINNIERYKTNDNGLIGYFIKENTYSCQVSVNGYLTRRITQEAISGQSVRTTYRLENTPPTLNHVVFNQGELKLTYNEDLDISSIPSATDFEVRTSGGINITVSAVYIDDIDEKDVILLLEKPLKDTDTVTISYTVGTNPIKDLLGSEADSFQKVFATHTTDKISLTTCVLLESLIIHDGTLDPAFDKNIVAYHVNTDNIRTSTAITAKLADPDSILTIAGISAKNDEKTTVKLDHGQNLIPIIITARDGSAQKSYVISVNGKVSNTELKSLTISGEVINFNEDINISVDNKTETIEISASPSDPKALVLIDGNVRTGGTIQTVNLAVGTNTIDMMVVAQDASTETYTITVNREAQLEIETERLPIGIVNREYNEITLKASGGSKEYTWEVVGLPQGLNYNSSGRIYGTPEVEFDKNITVTAIDVNNPISDSKSLRLKINLGCGNGGYVITPESDDAYTTDITDDDFVTMTVKQDGFQYFSVNVTPVKGHDGKEVIVFVHLRNGKEIRIDAMKADFDTIDNAEAGFNVQQGDVIKVFIVDDLSNNSKNNFNVL